MLFRNRAGGGVLIQKSNQWSCTLLGNRHALNTVLSMISLSTPKHVKKQTSDGCTCANSVVKHLIARLLMSVVVCGPSDAPLMTATKRAASVLRCCVVNPALTHVKHSYETLHSSGGIASRVERWFEMIEERKPCTVFLSSWLLCGASEMFIPQRMLVDRILGEIPSHLVLEQKVNAENHARAHWNLWFLKQAIACC